MTPVSLACPYCNSLVVLPRLPGPDQRIRCPRCQELFPYHGEPGAVATGELPSGQAAAKGMLSNADSRISPPNGRLSNRALARVVVTLMVLMAGAALIFAWTTKDQRRQRDGRRDAEAAPVPVVAPAKLAGLGYLPSDLNFVAGIHVGELWDKSGSSRQLLQLLEEQPSIRLQDLERSTALKLRDIDHVAVGLKIQTLSLMIVVKTRQPYNQSDVREALKAGRGEVTGSRTLYPFAVERFPQTAHLWCPDERTLVFYLNVLSTPNFSDAPLSPLESVDRFPLGSVLAEQLKEGTQVWCVGQSGEALPLHTYLQLLQKMLPGAPLMAKDNLRILSAVRSVAAWMQFSDEDVTYHAEADCGQEATATKLNSLLAENGLERGKSPPFLEGVHNAKELGEELGANLKREQRGKRIILEADSRIQRLIAPLFTKRSFVRFKLDAGPQRGKDREPPLPPRKSP